MIKDLQPRLAEAGKIKIGGLGAEKNSKSGSRYRTPRKDDHFTITTTQRGDDGRLIVDVEIMDELRRQGFADADGKVRTLPIILHADEMDEIFPTAYCAYQGKKLVCRGDGETAIRREIVQGEWTGEEKEIGCPCKYLQPDERGQRRCKPNGTLHCSLALHNMAVAGAVHKWRTTSIISINQMVGSLTQVRDKVVGTLQGVPLILRVSPMAVNPNGGRPSTVYVCHVELRAKNLSEIQRKAIEASQTRQNLSLILKSVNPEYQAMLSPPGADEDELEVIDIADEYYPDTLPAAPSDTEQAEMIPPSKPATPPLEQEPQKRTRRTKCSSCGQMFGPGIVKDGQCTDCRSTEFPESQQKQDEPVPPSKPATPPLEQKPETSHKDAVVSIIRETIQRGANQHDVMIALDNLWPDYESREFSAEDIDDLRACLEALS